MGSESLEVAVIEGMHPYDAIGFHRLFREMDGVDAYVQSFETWGWDWGANADKYDTTVFYNFHKEAPEDPQHPTRMGLNRLNETKKGIVVLHHALLAFPNEPAWTQFPGVDGSSFDNYYPDQDLRVQVARKEHPIVQGLANFDIHDETYTMGEPDSACEVLLTTAYEKSMKALAWTRMQDGRRVFCTQLGHDGQAWACPEFREVLRRGILWSAGQLG